MASVLQLISSLTVGGSERLLINFAASCATGDSVRQVVFVVINDKVNEQFASELMASGHPTYFLKRTPGERNPRIILTLLRIMRRHDVRLIHAHDSGAKHFAMLGKLYRSMSVGYTIHNTGIVASWDRVRLRLHQRFVDWNIAISSAVERECRHVNLQRIFKVHNGIPLASFCAPDRPRRLGTPLRLINVARLYPRQKGQDILIKALGICLSRNLDVRCDFVGSPPDGDRTTVEFLQKLASAERVSNRIRFLYDRTDVPALLGDADVFVLPSRYEGFGLALLEAMAMGVPVIAADIDGPAELLIDGSNGVKFKVGSAEDLAEKIIALASQPEIATRIAATAKRFVTKLDIAHMRDQYLNIYTQMMKAI
ncbi:glycosyltransferase family 4 protein [Bradyrhizobium sp. LHD-71]|uniref:glycosyltransferase family 4 protein n=1 Tax=Bradyrhizobium sp. LHD-71 TaxID=3072141 RepID=UPI00280E33EA|nr:glycosyltransferase family 4 protein [Bradyrhizobium sp. LHD-71]MDQ8729783.1 glycosyltransferase family 4 protein [Bradyrhizobium sp. LHD-71]